MEEIGVNEVSFLRTEIYQRDKLLIRLTKEFNTD